MSKAFDKKLSKMAEAYKKPESRTEQPKESPTNSRLFNLDVNEDEIFKVDLKDISPNPKNIREGEQWKDDQDFKNLVESIELMGLQQNLVVRRRKPEDQCQTEYILISGHRRFEALKILHEKHPDDMRFAYAYCLIASYEKNAFLSPAIAEELAIVSTNVEVRGLTNAEQIAAVTVYEKAYEEIRKKIKKIKEEAQDPVTKKYIRELTPDEKELMNAIEGCARSRDFAANALNISARKISNLRRINNKLINPYKKAFLNNLFSTEAAILLAGQDIEVQTLFKKHNVIPIENITKADIEDFLMALKQNNLPEAIDHHSENEQHEEKSVNLKNELQKSIKQIKPGEIILTSEQYRKYMRYIGNIEKEVEKITKLLRKAE